MLSKQIIPSTLILGAIILYFAWHFGVSVWQDHKLDKSKLIPSTNYHIAEGKCRKKLSVFSFCDIGLTHKTTNKKIDFKYFILGNMDAKTIYSLQTPDGQFITTNIGIENLTNRIVLITAYILLFLFICFVGIAIVIKEDIDRDNDMPF